MKKVLVLIYTPTFGGPHNQVLRLTAPLIENGWKSLVALPKEDGNGFEKLSKAGIEVIKLDLARIRASSISANLRYLSTFKKQVKSIENIIHEENIDVVQICGLMHIHGAIAAMRMNVPIVWQLLSTFAPPLLRGIYALIVSYYAHVVMSTGRVVAKKHLFNSFFWNKLIPFYPPVDTSLFKFDKKKRLKARKELNIPKDAFVVGTIGNQNRQKSHQEFLKIIDRLQESIPRLYARIVGKKTPSQEEKYTKNVIEYAERNGLFQNNKLLIQEPILPIDVTLCAYDVFLITSFAEGVPTVILEAMSIGLPVISTNVGSISEIIEDEENGFLYEYGEIDPPAYHILELYNDPAKRQLISKNNRQKAVNQYDIKICKNAHLRAYKKAVNQINDADTEH